jgi:hypothetical protein
MALRYSLIAVLLLAGCANQHRPPYATVTELAPDCANARSHIRYLTNLKATPVQSGDNQYLYDRTIDIQIARLKHYCS